MQNSNELYHHGVKGQKWGVRKKLSNANLSVRGARKFHKWREGKREAKVEKWEDKVERTKNTSALNPIYTHRLGKVQAHQVKLEKTRSKIKAADDFLTLYDKYNEPVSKIINQSNVEKGMMSMAKVLSDPNIQSAMTKRLENLA